MLSKQLKIKELKEYFKERKDVAMAFVFGSFAKGRAVRESDIDIAVYFKPKGRAIELEEERNYPGENKIWEDVERILGREIDFLVLNRARSTVAFDVLQTGIPIIIKDRLLYWKFYSSVHFAAMDFIEFAKDYRRIKDRARSLSERDLERLARLIEFLQEEIKSYSDFKNLKWEEYASDRHKKRDVEHWLENVVNSSIDIAKTILASEKVPTPETYRDTLKSLMLIANFDKKIAEKMADLANLRNIITHEYLDIRWERIQKFIRSSKPLYEYLVKFVKDNYLKVPLKKGGFRGLLKNQ